LDRNSKVRTGKNLSDASPNQNGLKQVDVLSSLHSIAQELCCHEDPRKWGGTGTEWNTSAPGLC